jgi:hydrogenase/urease accessory protein HupE
MEEIMSVSMLLAHAGHAGDHGWLAGALQPLLSLDHLAAGLFVAGALSLGLNALLRRSKRGVAETTER